MNILLDTQVLIWIIHQDKRLGPKALKLVSNIRNKLNASYFSLFEMSVKSALDKLIFNPSQIHKLRASSINLLMPDIDSLHAYKIFNPFNKDPFDNILIATAKTHRLALLTSDKKILATRIRSLKLINAKQ